MAVIYLANDVKHGRDVAIKVLRPDLSATVGTERFLREIEFAASLAHPHILPLYDSGDADGLLYFVMPYVEGESLRAHLSREGAMPLPEALRIARQVADGLAYAHDHGVLHRDIKPGNILLTERHAVIMDFGIARAIALAGAGQLTAAGTTVGTLSYMSPEQAMGDKLDARSDVYSAGCVLFEMLTGHPPFAQGDARAVLAQHLAGPIPSVRDDRPELPAEVDDLVTRCLAKSPSERVASAQDLLDDLSGLEAAHTAPTGVSRGRRTPERGLTGWHRRAAIATAVAVLGAAITLWRAGWLAPDPAVAASANSFVVLPFRPAIATDEEMEQATEGAYELTRQLNSWEPARAVSQVALTGPMFDLGLTGGVIRTLEDGVAVAREMDVGRLIALTFRLRGDSADVEAQIVTVGPDGSDNERPITSRGPRADLFSLLAPITREVLGLTGPEADLESLRRLSAYPEAIRQYEQGRRALERWRLEEAQGHFQTALREDSTFALAHHSLGLTLYWMSARDANRLASLGPEVRRRTAAARRHAGALAGPDSAHVLGFYSFVEGDFDRAREAYHGLLRRDSTDSYAWLLLGSVEYADPWLVDRGGGALRPRADWNLATRAFLESVRLSPDFFLGYGHLFDLYQRLAAGGCPAFWLPGSELQPAWAAHDASRTRPFCMVAHDSIEWVDPVAGAAGQSTQAAVGADSVFQIAIRRVERWVEYAGAEARPEEELAAWELTRRARLPQSTSPAEFERVTRQALEHTANALALKGDTTAEDHVRLATLLLATGDAEGAMRRTETALSQLLSESGDRVRPPPAAASVFVAHGQPTRAAEVMSPSWGTRSSAVRDSVQGRNISYGDVEPILGRLQVYGATGVTGPALRSAFDSLHQAWSKPAYDPRENTLLRRAVLGRVGAALVLDDAALARWLEGLGPWSSVWLGPVWEGFSKLPTDEVGAVEALLRTVEEERERRGGAISDYLIGILARRTGQDSLAVEFFRRLENRPLGVRARQFDPAWGLRSLAYLWRARAHEALEEREEAAEAYAEFVKMWRDAEPALQPLVAEARMALQRLRVER